MDHQIDLQATVGTWLSHRDGANDFVTILDLKLESMATYSGNSADMEENLSAISKWTSDQQELWRQSEEREKLQSMVDFLSTTSASLAALRSGDNTSKLQASLAIVDSALPLLAGPATAICGKGLCSFLTVILQSSQQPLPDLATQLQQVVHSELLQLQERVVSADYCGLEMRMSNLMRILDQLSPDGPVPTELEGLPRDLMALVGRLASVFGGPYSDCDRRHIVQAMVVYTYAQTSAQVLLTAILGKYRDLGMDTRFVRITLETFKEHAVQHLSFLSETRYLDMEGTLFDKKFHKIYALRINSIAYRTVECLRRSVGLPEMLRIDEIETIKTRLDASKGQPRIDRLARPHMKIPHKNYFQLVNRTDFAVKVRFTTTSGALADAMGTDYVMNVKPRHTHQKAFRVTRLLDYSFSAAGYYVVYHDSQTPQPDRRPFEGDIRVTEFAFGGSYYNKYGKPGVVMDATDRTTGNLGQRSRLNRYDDAGKGLVWKHADKHYWTQGLVSNGQSSEGYCRTWTFVVQEFSPNSDMI